MNRKNHYHTLGIEKNATNNEIRSAYRKLAHQFHPDHNHQENAPQMFIEIKEAYDTLIDENKRAKYDLQEPLATSYQTNNNYENENDLKAEDLHNDAYDFNSEPEEEAIVQHGLTILKIIP
jgi:DnaJ-class molecular chaperone